MHFTASTVLAVLLAATGTSAGTLMACLGGDGKIIQDNLPCGKAGGTVVGQYPGPGGFGPDSALCCFTDPAKQAAYSCGAGRTAASQGSC